MIDTSCSACHAAINAATATLWQAVEQPQPCRRGVYNVLVNPGDALQQMHADACLKRRRWGFDYFDFLLAMDYSSDAIARDFLTVMYRMQAMGFNAVRVPMSFTVGFPNPYLMSVPSASPCPSR